MAAGPLAVYGEGVSFWALGEMVKAQAGILESDSAGLRKQSSPPRCRRSWWMNRIVIGSSDILAPWSASRRRPAVPGPAVG